MTLEKIASVLDGSDPINVLHALVASPELAPLLLTSPSLEGILASDACRSRLSRKTLDTVREELVFRFLVRPRCRDEIEKAAAFRERECEENSPWPQRLRSMGKYDPRRALNRLTDRLRVLPGDGFVWNALARVKEWWPEADDENEKGWNLLVLVTLSPFKERL